MLSLATVLSGFCSSKSPTTGKSVLVWAFPGRGKLNAPVPISPMNSRLRINAPNKRQCNCLTSTLGRCQRAGRVKFSLGCRKQTSELRMIDFRFDPRNGYRQLAWPCPNSAKAGVPALHGISEKCHQRLWAIPLQARIIMNTSGVACKLLVAGPQRRGTFQAPCDRHGNGCGAPTP